MKNLYKILISLAIVSFAIACGGGGAPDADPMENKGIGPISSVTLGEINPAMADQGEKTFKQVCQMCHRLDADHIGPALRGITNRRSPEWIMNLVMNTSEMLQKDPIAMELKRKRAATMAVGDLTESDVRNLLEYLRTQE